MNTLYLECFSGISGDMLVASLLDLGANQDGLFRIIDAMDIDCKIHINKTKRNGILSLRCDVEIADEDKCCRGINDVYPIINNSQLSDNAKSIAKKIFCIIADAEAVVHKKTREEVHFHEVGSLDSIIDICAVAYCLDDLNIDRVVCSPLSDGSGFAQCAHGKIPIPAPAVAEIARAKNIPINITDNDSEMITPTGIAIIGAIGDDFKIPREIRFKKIGIGAGKKEFGHPNILRAFIIEKQDKNKSDEKIIFIETAIDDSTPEELAFCLEELFKAGVNDAFYSPIYMKKNRPAWQLSLMCKPEIEQDVISIIFKQTTAIGVRRQVIERVVMKREKTKIDTKLGKVDANKFTWKSIEKTCLEYESVKKLAEEKGCSILDIYRNY